LDGRSYSDRKVALLRALGTVDHQCGFIIEPGQANSLAIARVKPSSDVHLLAKTRYYGADAASNLTAGAYIPQQPN
jgi:hypothetical protein